MRARTLRATTHHVRVPTRLRQVAPRPPVGTIRVAIEDPWDEIEALLTAPSPMRRRRVSTRIVRRAVAGIALVIAAGGLALGSVGVLSRVCNDGRCWLETAGTTAPASPTLAEMTSEPRADATMAEGRSVAGPVAAEDAAQVSPKGAAANPPGATGAAPARDAATTVETLPTRRTGLRHRHRDRRGLVYREAWR